MKRFFINMMIFLLSIPAYCQIQNTFFDCKLGGNVSMNQFKSNLQKLGYEYQVLRDNGEARLLIHDCRYLGEHWDVIFILFYKDIFYEVTFWKASYDEKEIDQDYELYKTVFMAKYSEFCMPKEYVVPRKSAKKTERFCDYENEISLILEHDHLDFEVLSFTYTDDKIASKKLWEELGSY